jgi:hypothetical protein
VADEVVAINCINSFLGRMHLASPIWLLNERKQAILQEGIAYMRTLNEAKKTSVPYLPIGYVRWGAPLVATGLISGNKLYLGVWNFDKPQNVKIPLSELQAKSAKVGYPTLLPTEFELKDNVLSINFTEKEQARFFEIELATN